MTSKASKKKVVGSSASLRSTLISALLSCGVQQTTCSQSRTPVNSCRLQLSTWGLQKYLLGAGQETGSRMYFSFSLGVSCAITHSIFILWSQIPGVACGVCCIALVPVLLRPRERRECCRK